MNLVGLNQSRGRFGEEAHMKSRYVSSSPEVYSNLLAAAKELGLTDSVLITKAFDVYFKNLKLDDLDIVEAKRLWQEYLDSKEKGVITEDD